MLPLRLFISNLSCHENSFIDFSQFNSAIIIGRKENDDLHSNGTGKSSIFIAIEYCLFGECPFSLDKIIRDDADACRVVLDFSIDDQIYRISRKRTRRGTSDLTLLMQNNTPNPSYYKIIKNDYFPVDDKTFWNDISGRRASDTERYIEKLIKTNIKSFRNSIHFAQNDFDGLSTLRPEKRKALLKEALNIAVYSKLEKIAKERASFLIKDIDKAKTLIENFGDLNSDLLKLKEQLSETKISLSLTSEKLKQPTLELDEANKELNTLILLHKELETKYSSLINQEKTLSSEISKISSSLKEYQDKKLLAIKAAKNIVSEIKEIKENISSLSEIDFNQIDILTEQVSELKQKQTINNVAIQNNMAELSELRTPMPDDFCKHCRQRLSEEHKAACKAKIVSDIDKCQKNIAVAKKEILTLSTQMIDAQSKIAALSKQKQQLDLLTNKLSLKNSELSEKKKMHTEITEIIEKFSNSLLEKENELAFINSEIEKSSFSEGKEIENKISDQKKKTAALSLIISSINKEIMHGTSLKAIIENNIEQKIKDQSKLQELKSKLIAIEKQYYTYPSVINAFSGTGIPALIIQNCLDDLQSKANDILNQLKPELQLSFIIEKTKSDGEEADTLDIEYSLSGRSRSYEQLSGAQKLSATFSLKLGLSFLLSDLLGTNIEFLLLDEVDQSLDAASIDQFAEIVRHFQDKFKILIISHNDRLKDKIATKIVVSQDSNMISRARVLS
jgi:DNA repair exonuclease SbcCD ATPase subunit